MNAWLAWGIPIITWMQALGDWLIAPMRFFTFLGTEQFYLLVLPAFLWCVDVGIGLRIGLILLISSGLNNALKLAFRLPRPYWVSGHVRALSADTSFGLPSGHAQTSLAIWGRVAAWARRRWAYLSLAGLVLLISLSRPFLGVHFPLDTLVGWVVGGALLALFLILDEPVRRWLASLSLGGQLAAALAASLLLLAIGLAAGLPAQRRGFPQSWRSQAAHATPDAEPIDPLTLDGILATSGTMLGLAAGAALLLRGPAFDPGGVWWRRAGRYALGAIGLVVVFYGLRAIFPYDATLLGQALRYVRYAATGLWVTYGAPRLFMAVGLA